MRFVSELAKTDQIIIASAVLIIGFALVRMIVPDAQDIKLQTELKAQLARSMETGASFAPNDDERIDHLPRAVPNLNQLRNEATRLRESHPEVILDKIQFDAMFSGAVGLHEKQMDALEQEARNAPDQEEEGARLTMEEVQALRNNGQMVW